MGVDLRQTALMLSYSPDSSMPCCLPNSYANDNICRLRHIFITRLHAWLYCFGWFSTSQILFVNWAWWVLTCAVARVGCMSRHVVVIFILKLSLR